MYKHFFGLRENPFDVNPDPRYMSERGIGGALPTAIDV